MFGLVVFLSVFFFHISPGKIKSEFVALALKQRIVVKFGIGLFVRPDGVYDGQQPDWLAGTSQWETKEFLFSENSLCRKQWKPRPCWGISSAVKSSLRSRYGHWPRPNDVSARGKKPAWVPTGRLVKIPRGTPLTAFFPLCCANCCRDVSRGGMGTRNWPPADESGTA